MGLLRDFTKRLTPSLLNSHGRLPSLMLAATLLAGTAISVHAASVDVGSLTGFTGSPVPAPGASAEDGAAIDQALQAAQAEQRLLAVEAGGSPAAAGQEEILARDHYLDHLVETLTRHKEALARLPEVRRHRDERQSEAAQWRGFASRPPYSLLLVDQLREALESANVEIQTARNRKALIEAESENAEKAYKADDVEVRQSEERIARETSAAERDRQSWLRDLARLKARADAEDVAEAQVAVKTAEAEEALQQAMVALLEKQLAVASSDVRFPQSDLDSILAAIDRETAVLDGRLKTLAAGAGALRREAERADKAVTEAAAAAATGEIAAQNPARLNSLRQEADLRHLQADNRDMAIDLGRRMLELRRWERAGWKYRWLLFNAGDAEKLHSGRLEVDRYMALLDNWSRYAEREIALSNGRAAEFELRQKGRLEPDEAGLMVQFLATERDKTEILRNAQQAADSMRRTLAVWRQELIAGSSRRSFSDRLDLWTTTIRRVGGAFWNFELFSAEDSIDVDGRKVVAARSVTVGKSLGVILLLVVGSLLIGRLLRFVRWLAVGRLGMNAGHTATALRWMHAVLLSMLCVVALEGANIPLTVFAFLGGALAIGVGFGTQILLKNMISGIMLLIERPLRVGDRIEVGAVVGTVSHISIRSSTVRTSDGIEILVPNSTFIENNVTNWTYSSGKVRRSVTVGVDYAIPSARVSEVLLSVAEEHPGVVADPPPRVLLEDFGADAMNYRLQFWIDYADGADGSLIASDLRMAIERAFRDAGIPIPFPQRVVYLKKAEDLSA